MATKEPINKVTLKSGKVRYRFVIDVGTRPDGGRDQRTYTYDTLKQARAERASKLADINKGTFVAPDKLTVSEYLDQWLAGKRNLRPGTRQRYIDNLLPVRERLGTVSLQRLSKSDLDKLVDWMLAYGRRKKHGDRTDLSARSVNITLTVLTNALKDAVRQGALPRNVAAMVERPTHKAPETHTWTADQAKVFLASVAEDRLYVAWRLALYGLRRGEVLGLRWPDVDLDAKTLTVNWTRTTPGSGVVEGPPKTARSVRTLPLDDALVGALRRLKARCGAEQLEQGRRWSPCDLCSGSHVIVDELGEARRPAWMTERFRELVTRSGLPVIRLHDLRHTTGTLMHLLGVPIAVISAWLGHVTAAFTMKQYVHSQDHALDAAGSSLGAALAM